MLAFVDEWGSPQPSGKGSPYFGFGAVLIPDSKIRDLRHWLGSVNSKLGKPANAKVHVRKLQAHRQYHVTRLLAESGLSVSTVIVPIKTISSQNLQRRGWCFRYYAREMVRVATHFAKSIGETANIVFDQHEYHKGFDEYIRSRLPASDNYLEMVDDWRIHYPTLGEMRFESNSAEPLLAAADCVAHACHLAFNPDSVWGAGNLSHLELLEPCFWRGPSPTSNTRVFGTVLLPMNSQVRTELVFSPTMRQKLGI